MLTHLSYYFKFYPETKAPFLHKQFREWQTLRPLQDLKVLHHVPLVPNTLLKIACLVAAGAEVVVTNPNFMSAHPNAIIALHNDGIRYVHDIVNLKREVFDLLFNI
jgi:adenosylhomocysteinase